MRGIPSTKQYAHFMIRRTQNLLAMELEVFQQFKPKLITAISDSVLKIAVKCRARGFINVLTYEKIVHKEHTSIQQATLLVDVVDKCITTDCANFEVFVDILDDELPPACKKPLSEMRESLKSLRDRRTFRLCTDDKMPSENSIVDVPRSPIKTMKQKIQKDFTKPSRSNSSKTLAHTISTDSGISVGRSDSLVSDRDVSFLKLNSTQSEDLAPIEETPLDNNHHQSSGVTSTTSPPVFSSASSTMSDRIRNLWLEAKQKEAVEISLKEDIEQLRDELDRTVREKQKAEEELRKKRREVAELTSAMKCERRELRDEIDGLKIQIADGEASRDKQASDFNRRLQKQKSKYEDDILARELEIEEKEGIICELRSKMLFLERRNALLQRSNSYEPGQEHKAKEGRGVDVIVQEGRGMDVIVQRSSSYDLREEIQQKDTQLQETEEKLLRCEKQLSKEQNCQTAYMVLVGLLVVVIAIVAHLYIYHRDNTHVQCFVRDFPM